MSCSNVQGVECKHAHKQGIFYLLSGDKHAVMLKVMHATLADNIKSQCWHPVIHKYMPGNIYDPSQKIVLNNSLDNKTDKWSHAHHWQQ